MKRKDVGIHSLSQKTEHCPGSGRKHSYPSSRCSMKGESPTAPLVNAYLEAEQGEAVLEQTN